MQITPRHYKHAPITEAVIAIGFESQSGAGQQDIRGMHDLLKSAYPKRTEVFEIQVQVEPTAELPGRSGSRQVIGYQFAAGDEKRIVRLGRTEFAFSQLAPYDRWETLRAEAKRVWDLAEPILGIKQITRVAVRYINRIDVADPDGRGIDLDRYLRTAPRIAPELPQMMRTYFVRLELEFKHPHGVVIITETAAPPPSPGIVAAVLDIDVIMQNVSFDAQTAWQTVEDLRHEKNRVFESCITDESRKLFV